jgi:hypothetical protein
VVRGLAGLTALDFASQAMLFGAGLLVSLLPFVILLSAFASQRIDDDISLRLGLDRRAAGMVLCAVVVGESLAVRPVRSVTTGAWLAPLVTAAIMTPAPIPDRRRTSTSGPVTGGVRWRGPGCRLRVRVRRRGA